MRFPFAALKLIPWALLLLFCVYAEEVETSVIQGDSSPRERFRLNARWYFWHSKTIPDNLGYDIRPDTNGTKGLFVLKPWILPSANNFISDPDNHHARPSDEPDVHIPYAEADFDDSDWETVNLPHDWAIKGPFDTDEEPFLPGTMGRLPVQGVGWYRRKVAVSADDIEKKSIYLDVDGAMSYPMVWLNGHQVGGWPYGYNSFRLDLTPHLQEGGDGNQLAIRVENPSVGSSRWYPGAGIYRNVWLTKVNPIHVAHWGTFITTTDVSTAAATVDLLVQVENTAEKAEEKRNFTVVTEIYEVDSKTNERGQKVADIPPKPITLPSNDDNSRLFDVSSSATLDNPRLWGPPPSQSPNLYVAVTRIVDGDSNDELDVYETQFGIRSLEFDGEYGLSVNGERVPIQGVNQHHDLGALGAAFNVRAAQRQLEMLHELGVNAIRMAHNPPAPELLELTDRMGFLVVDEVFDCWSEGKMDADFHLIFPDWREPDLRSFMRRDRNHPSVIVWSYGNEVAEQSSDDALAAEIATYLRGLVVDEDTTRPSTFSINYAAPNMSLPRVADILNLNYQGEGVRYGPAYEHLEGGIKKTPQYGPFHEAFPDKLVYGSEVAWSLSSRGTFLVPVTSYNGAPANDSFGADSDGLEMCGYELYTSEAGSSADRVFATQDEHSFVAGGFVWSGFDYLGEPYPWDTPRGAYSGIIDLAGFKKERFYLYQSRWRPDLPMAHIVPHWNWPEDRVGKVTPVHVFTSGDEAELFVNGKSQGRQKKEPHAYRFRWDEVAYEPGEVRVVVYKDGEEWATNIVNTTGEATGLRLTADRDYIASDGEDLSFITVEVVDDDRTTVPEADNTIKFSVSAGPGEIVGTDNGFPGDLTSFPSKERQVYHGLALAIVRAEPGASQSTITVSAESKGLAMAEIMITLK